MEHIIWTLWKCESFRNVTDSGRKRRSCLLYTSPGDFGISTKTGRDIKTLIFESFHVSAKLGGMAILVALAFGLVFGSLAALTRNKLPDRLIIFFSTLFTSLPSFVFATLLLLVFCVQLKLIQMCIRDRCSLCCRFARLWLFLWTGRMWKMARSIIWAFSTDRNG